MSFPRVGRYHLLERIGSGGMADVFLAREGAAGEIVAIKRLHEHLAGHPVPVAMFLAEGRLGPRLVHPNLCRVHGGGETDGVHYLVMEYLEGLSFAALLEASGALPAGLVAGLIDQAAAGLEHAHDLLDDDGAPLDLVHGDVCPENLFITTDGVVKVLDFGIADTRDAAPETRTGALRGKVRYMPPEQLRSEPLDRRADVYALGACAFELLSGRPAFDADNAFAVQRSVLEGPTPRLDDAPALLDAVVARAMEPDRTRRFASARELAAALAAAVDTDEEAWDPGHIAGYLAGIPR